MHYMCVYTEYKDGLFRKLGNPCRKLEPTVKDLSQETKNNWEISRDELELKELLGTGNFGEVHEG